MLCFGDAQALAGLLLGCGGFRALQQRSKSGGTFPVFATWPSFWRRNVAGQRAAGVALRADYQRIEQVAGTTIQRHIFQRIAFVVCLRR